MSIDLAKAEVRVRWRYRFPRAQVFAAVAEGRLLMTCGGRMNEFRHDFRVGGRYQYAWAPGKTCQGEYLEIVPDERVRFTWGDCNAGEDAAPSEVTATLSTKGGYTYIEIHHVKAPSADLAHSYHQGWTEVLALFQNELDGTTIRLRQELDFPPAQVHQALSRGGLFRYTVPSAAEYERGSIDFRVGGKYSYPCGKDDSVSGEFVKITPERIMFTWSTMDRGLRVEDTEVDLYLEALPGNRTRLHLVHDGLAPEIISPDHVEGWRDALAKFPTFVGQL